MPYYRTRAANSFGLLVITKCDVDLYVLVLASSTRAMGSDAWHWNPTKFRVGFLKASWRRPSQGTEVRFAQTSIWRALCWMIQML